MGGQLRKGRCVGGIAAGMKPLNVIMVHQKSHQKFPLVHAIILLSHSRCDCPICYRSIGSLRHKRVLTSNAKNSLSSFFALGRIRRNTTFFFTNQIQRSRDCIGTIVGQLPGSLYWFSFQRVPRASIVFAHTVDLMTSTQRVSCRYAIPFLCTWREARAEAIRRSGCKRTN